MRKFTTNIFDPWYDDVHGIEQTRELLRQHYWNGEYETHYILHSDCTKPLLIEAMLDATVQHFTDSSIPIKDQLPDPTKPETSPLTADAIPSLIQGQDDTSRLPLRNSDQPSQAASQLPTKSPAALQVSSNLSPNSRYGSEHIATP
jgi:hypothetical protein